MKIYQLIPVFVFVLTACARPQESVIVMDSALANNPPESIQVASATPNTQLITQSKSITATVPISTTIPQNTPEPSLTDSPTEVLAPTEPPASPKEPVVLGPDQFSPGINPLSGLPAADPALLALPPALVSITNFPVSARPQAGLSFSPYVYELYIGEGMTRFLAMFYGEYPQVSMQNTTDTSVIANNQAEIGPVRSGRLPYQAIRQLYNGFLVMASASAEVKQATSDFTNIFGSDTDDINSALIDVTRLQAIAETHESQVAPNLTGNLFSEVPPEHASDEDAQNAKSLWVFYNFLNQIQWEYDPVAGAYLRFQDNADGSGQFYPATDRLTGEQLAFENVIVLFAKHQVLNSQSTLIDVDLLYSKGYAYLFRDGKVYPIYWNTIGGEYEKTTGLLRPIRFTDRNGDPIPLKPGSTWVELVDLTTLFYEIEPGSWKARFYAP